VTGNEVGGPCGLVVVVLHDGLLMSKPRCSYGRSTHDGGSGCACPFTKMQDSSRFRTGDPQGFGRRFRQAISTGDFDRRWLSDHVRQCGRVERRRRGDKTTKAVVDDSPARRSVTRCRARGENDGRHRLCDAVLRRNAVALAGCRSGRGARHDPNVAVHAGSFRPYVDPFTHAVLGASSVTTGSSD
jgi:hypothetical protein